MASLCVDLSEDEILAIICYTLQVHSQEIETRATTELLKLVCETYKVRYYYK